MYRIRAVFHFITNRFLGLFSWYKHRSRTSKIVIAILIVLLCYVGWKFLSGKNKAGTYLTEYPKIEPITEIVTESGNVTTSARMDMYSTTTGMVDRVTVKNGDRVKSGDALFSVISSATDQEKDSARSTYLSAKATLDGAKATQYSLQATMFDVWDSFKTLAENDTYKDEKSDNRTVPEFLISQKEWLAAEANYKNQEQKIKQAQVSVNATWEAYQATQDSTIKAPIAGKVYNLAITESDMVQAKSVVGARPVLVVADLTKTRVKIELNEIDIPKVAVGQKANVKIDALPDMEFDGVVAMFDTIGQDVQGIITYNVYIDLIDPDSHIRPGMTATADITVASKTDALTVSSTAIRPHEGARAVQIVDPITKKPSYVTVTIGLRSEGRTEVTSGIDEHTRVITALSNEQVNRSSGGFFGQ